MQADVYAGVLYHLSILLPNLTTGANFGITSMLTGLIRMIQLGEVTQETRQFERGNDGGSENVALAGLAMNSMLISKAVRRFDTVLQNRLPPGHSHHWLTDGTFSVIEGWTTGPGFAGCNTLSELVDYLLKKFSSAKNFKDKLVEIKVQLVNFAFVKWFSGHINADKVKRIGDPLVWRHSWVASEERVKVQYKYAMSDSQSFERDEWGPWEERVAACNDPDTGAVIYKTVLRSTADGVDLMASYPNIADDPGFEDWIDDDKWQLDKVWYTIDK